MPGYLSVPLSLRIPHCILCHCPCGNYGFLGSNDHVPFIFVTPGHCAVPEFSGVWVEFCQKVLSGENRAEMLRGREMLARCRGGGIVLTDWGGGFVKGSSGKLDKEGTPAPGHRGPWIVPEGHHLAIQNPTKTISGLLCMTQHHLLYQSIQIKNPKLQ